MKKIIFMSVFLFSMHLCASQSGTFEKWEELSKDIKTKILNDHFNLRELVKMYPVSKPFLSLIKNTPQHKNKTIEQIKELTCGSEIMHEYPFLKITIENILNFINKELENDQCSLSQINIFDFSFLEKCNLCLEEKYSLLKNDKSLLVKKESIWGDIDAVGLPLKEILYYYKIEKLKFYQYLGDNENFNIIKREVCEAFDSTMDGTGVYVRCKNYDSDDSEF